MCDVLPLRLCFGELVTLTKLWTCLDTISAEIITVLTRYRPIVLELI